MKNRKEENTKKIINDKGFSEKPLKNHSFLRDIESNLGAIIFAVITVLLFLQVFSRFVLKNAYTWTEELSVILFTVMVYIGISAAAIERKHLKIDFVQEIVSFKGKRTMLIISNILMIIFCIGIVPPLFYVIQAMANSKTSILRIPMAIGYFIIGVCMITTVVRTIQDTIKLLHETEETIGSTKPILDLNAIEAEYLKNKTK